MNAKRIVFSLSLLTVLIFVLFNNSCRHDPVGIDKFEAVCFDTQIQPILQSSCGMSGCHGSGGEGGFSPSNYQSIMDIVQPGNAAKSELYQVITSVNGGNMMPPNQPLTKEQRTLIMIWIEQGAKSTCP